MGPSLFIVVAAVLVAAAVVGWIQGHKRRQALAAWASEHGLAVDISRDRTMEQRYPMFGCFRQGSNRYAELTIKGEWRGRAFVGFDYHYETYSRSSKGHKTTHHHRFSGVIMESSIPLQPLLIRPERIFDKVAGFFGVDDINFESAEFSRKFFVKAPNRRWAFDVLHARAMEHLLNSPRFTIEFEGRHVLALLGAQRGAARFAAAGDVICGLLDALPEYVIRQQTGQDTFRA